ncbi:hypothetical protein [Parasphingorhabdus sp.]|uniref:hypothetical protein n=1 Tax=Parasphingorhabdus sp. TaxID=2709688 RepID=UPI0032656971
MCRLLAAAKAFAKRRWAMPGLVTGDGEGSAVDFSPIFVQGHAVAQLVRLRPKSYEGGLAME